MPAGQALAAAQELAAQLAAFPQVCLRSDRASVLDQEGLDESAALAAEFAHGRAALTARGRPGRRPVRRRGGPPRLVRPLTFFQSPGPAVTAPGRAAS